MIYYHGINKFLNKDNNMESSQSCNSILYEIRSFLGFLDKNIQERLEQMSDIWDLKDQPDTSHTS